MIKKYVDDLIDLRSQKVRVTKSGLLNGETELQDEKIKVSNLLKKNKTRIHDCNVQISLLHQDNDKKRLNN